MNTSGRPHFFGLLAGLFLAVGLIFSAMLVTRAWIKIAEAQTISVTGSARKNVRSDLIIWRGSFSADGDTLVAAQNKLKGDWQKVERFIQKCGVTNHLLSSISIQEMRFAFDPGIDQSQRKTGYRLSQSVEVSSADTKLIDQLENGSTALVEDGVYFTPHSTTYIYTKANDAKVEMLAEATKDARARAEQISKQGGRVIHQLRSAKMGVFQITPLHSVQTSWEGVNDTSSLDKTITAVVSTAFSLK